MRIFKYVFLVLVNVVFLTSCVSVEHSSSNFGYVTIADLVVTCLSSDNAVVLKALLDKGLPIDNYYNATGNFSHIPRRGNANAFPSRTILLEALRLNAHDCVRLLLEHRADVVKADDNGNNALILAAFLSEDVVLDVVNEIRSFATFDVDATNIYNVTALGAAVIKNNGVYVRWLLEHGADYTASYGVNDLKRFNFKRPILFDAINARQDIFEMFMEKPCVDVSYVDCKGDGILMWLDPRNEKYEERFRCLIDRGARIGDSPAHRNILIKNMKILGDCPHRISMICSFKPNQIMLEKASAYAKEKNYIGSMNVIDCYLLETTNE